MIDEVVFYGNSGGFHGILTFLNIKTELQWRVDSWKILLWFIFSGNYTLFAEDMTLFLLIVIMFIHKVCYIDSQNLRVWTSGVGKVLWSDKQ